MFGVTGYSNLEDWCAILFGGKPWWMQMMDESARWCCDDNLCIDCKRSASEDMSMLIIHWVCPMRDVMVDSLSSVLSHTCLSTQCTTANCWLRKRSRLDVNWVMHWEPLCTTKRVKRFVLSNFFVTLTAWPLWQLRRRIHVKSHGPPLPVLLQHNNNTVDAMGRAPLMQS